ncbi:MAG: protein translocase subunit SecF [Candidatus Dormibacteraeota bacterium]|nr:protein translocase subunit SecF [Candidatus Dormibacteraeota bacterium]
MEGTGLAPAPEVSGTPVPAAVEPRKSRTLDVIGARNWYFLFSLIVIIPGIISMATQGFLLGIDFQGGTEFFLKFRNNPDLAQVQQAVSSQGLSGVVQKAANGSYLIRTAPISPIQQKQFETILVSRLGPEDDSFRQVNEVGPTIANEIVRGALIAVVSASSLILLYLAFRFRKVQGGFRSGFQFGGSALLALLHDVFLLTGIFSILGKGIPFLGFHGLRIGEVDSLFLTAVLTVVGFSVHDTIVIFDRIRENMIVSQRLTFEQIVNLSIMQSAARSIITSFTVVLVLLSLLLFGGDTLKGFVLALLIGIVSGTYSSIFNAAPLLTVWRRLQPVR